MTNKYISHDAYNELNNVCDRFREHLFEAAEIAAKERNSDTVEVRDIPIRIGFSTREQLQLQSNDHVEVPMPDTHEDLDSFPF